MIAAKTSNEAMAFAMSQINPDVVAAYPITPATEVVQIFSDYVANGVVDTQFVAVESEHSALSACIGAACAGGRVITSTASQGLALMHEMLYIASGLRLPIVICLVNRSLSSPINIHCDHSDTMGSRDAGWIQIYCENSQEAYDSVIQAVRIAEAAELPVIVAADAFILSHCMERIELLSNDEVQSFVGEHRFRYSLLDTDHPLTVGPLDLQDYYFEHKRSQIQGVQEAWPHIEGVAKEFGDRFGRHYPILEPYKTDDAEIVLLVMGSTAGTAKDCVDELRREGRPVGLLRLRVFRPFPARELARALSHFKVVGVMDRVDSLSGQGGPLFAEARAALYEAEDRPILVDYVYGLGGREVDSSDIERVYNELERIRATGRYEQLLTYLGVREGGSDG